MDIATIIGLVGGTILVILAIATGGDVSIFLNIPGLLIVVGGTLATCFIKFTMADVINSVSVAMKAFMVKINPPEEIMEEMVSIAKVAKERGLMALEDEAPDDEFAAKAFQFLADGFDETQIKELLKKDINHTVQRHTIGQKVTRRFHQELRVVEGASGEGRREACADSASQKYPAAGDCAVQESAD